MKQIKTLEWDGPTLIQNNITVVESFLILQYHSILRLNCKQSSPFKYFYMAIRYSFLFTRKFGEYLFSRYLVLIYLFARKKRLPGVIIPWGL